MAEVQVVTVRLAGELHQALRDRVTADRSIQSQVVEAIEQYLKAQRN